ncbi:PD-(D/E)XK nuclease family protein [Paracidovorax valerianellae]|uniref:ATP-dependent helicase/nuclease subunit B n=1 Tax=Paracidovorax valerianellae TaxID=187868 RepID=A0A1G6IU72_9BURK|nr:PD-(D/E)XK nuclease family protein [Paracidovorax valerianellae]MDA8443697.1 PD-(D/E)XK nuclease family protein [Paracidovorax valerianellae]SDC09973.1 ATP-dependent helicase/nuclease subunit B [Paracidovorax valerianellae]
MTVIAKNDAPGSVWGPVLSQVQAHIQRIGAHPATVVVLVPYAQLMAEAQREWARRVPDGFAPRFETTRNWATRIAPFVPEGDDLSHDMARDTLTARALLDRAGLAEQRDVLATPLLEAAAQLSSVVCAVPPPEREAWAIGARELMPPAGEGAALRYEAAVARIALEWVLASRHATDVLFEPGVRTAVDALVVLGGFQSDPLAQTLCARWGDRSLALALGSSHSAEADAPLGEVFLHAAADAEDEAQRAAACVLHRLEQGHAPLALAAIDRALTRRISALLLGRGVAVHDENGWTLSTTRAASQVMTALRACAWNASADAVLDWLKHAPAADPVAVSAAEKWLRKAGMGQWLAVQERSDAMPPALEAVQTLVEQVQAWRTPLQSARPLAAWIAAVRELLQGTGQWNALAADAAGERVLAELRLHDGLPSDLDGLESAGRRMSLAEFTRWVNEVLEAARYRPDHDGSASVFVVPLPQILARPFATLVVPGCDEKRLQPAPEPPGAWTRAQREGLGLPTREALESALRDAWGSALHTAHVDVLWRSGDDGGEPLLASPLVLALQLDGMAQDGTDPRGLRDVPINPVPRPMPTGEALPVLQLSSTAYSDLRHCPYRFFALRQLGLQEADELGAEVGKRDFGNWLHAVLQRFHEALQAEPTEGIPERRALMDAAAEAVTRSQRLDAGEFLPFASGWPALRDGYLRWLREHEGQGATFRQAEVRSTQPLGPLKLVGLLDRIDAVRAELPGEEPTVLVIDYKTESDAVTRKRLAAGTEDTQLAFYAALLHHDHLRAAYVNVGERGETRTFEQVDVVALRDQLVEGILHDFDRIAGGAPLPALGEGAVCDYCAARGLCRKDFWA